MTRGFGLVSLLVTLVLVGFMWTRSTQDAAGPASLGSQSDAAKVTAAFNLQQAAPALETWRAEHGTYAGASLPASFGVTVVRSDATSYCLQAGVGTEVEHLAGPGGSAPVDGPC